MEKLLGGAPPPERAAQALEVVRITVAILILIHGIYRAAAGIVEPFGTWLSSLGFPYGYGWAAAVTVIEWIGPVLILLRRYVFWACLVHISILSLGLVLVHLPEGWFVVGAGRNGVEYSVFLIVSLAAIAWAYRPQMKA